MISVFTPSHDPRFLNAVHDSLLMQTHEEWEWVVLLNGSAKWEEPDDPRVKVWTVPRTMGVGEAKALAVEHCEGDILVELDHDDVLTVDALAEIEVAFEEHPDAGLVYSQWAGIDAEGGPTFTEFAEGIGWRYRNAIGRTYPIAMEPTPHNVCHIWYAPNHVRAFTRVAYDKAGGYDRSLDVLDDQDLMARLYVVGEFVLIDKVLYLQRSHDNRTSAGRADQPQTERNARIQVETLWMYDRTIEQAALAWASRRNLPCFDLGGIHGKPDGYFSVDQHEGADIVHTFPTRLGWPDSSVGVIRASDFLEHVADKVAMMNEIHRLLVPGGMLLSMTPSSEGWGADQDPTHVSRWNPNSFWYFTDPNYAAYVPEIKARFQVSRVVHGYPSPWHEENRIPYVWANLIAVKPGMPRNGGVLRWTEEP